MSVDHTHLTRLLSILNRLAEVAMTFDPSLILLCWKYLAKLVCQMKSHLSDITQTILPIIQQLRVTMETMSIECVMSVYEIGGQTFSKLLKLCRFLSTLLIKMLSVSRVHVQLLYVLSLHSNTHGAGVSGDCNGQNAVSTTSTNAHQGPGGNH